MSTTKALLGGVVVVFATSADRLVLGLGLSIVVLAGFAVVLAVETTVAGSAVGLPRS